MTDKHEIAFNVASVEGAELDHIARVARGRPHVLVRARSRARCRDLLRAETGAADVLLTTSCTAALEMSALLLDLQPGDTVIVPSFTFVSSALAFVREGARILFCDIEPETLGLDPQAPRRAARRLRARGRGRPLRRHRLRHGRASARCWPTVPTSRSSRTTPTASSAAGAASRSAASAGSPRLSFHETKNFVCGEGGALLLNDPPTSTGRGSLYDKGTDRKAFFQGQVDKYSWRDTGSSFGLSDALAAYLLGQLEQREVIQAQAPRRLRAVRRGAGAARRGARAAAARWCRSTASRRTTSSTCCCPTTRPAPG